MKILMNALVIVICTFTFCLNMTQAQILPLPVTSLPTAVPRPTTEVPLAAKSVGKYSEYLSYCRENNPHGDSRFTDEQKQRRLDLLAKKLAADPKNQFFINALLKEYFLQKKILLAEDFLNKNKTHLSDEDLIVWDTELDLANKKISRASSQLDKFIIAHPASNKALIQLARVKKIQSAYTEAAEIFKDLEIKNKKSDYSLELCELYTLDSMPFEAENSCLKASKKHPEDPLPEIYLGIMFREREMYKQAELHFKASLNRQKTEFALTCLGELFYLKKDLKKTIEYLNQAIEKNKFSSRAYIGLALTQFENKKYELALESFKEACKLNSKNITEMLKSQKVLDNLKLPVAQKYFDEIQRCQKITAK